MVFFRRIHCAHISEGVCGHGFGVLNIVLEGLGLIVPIERVLCVCCSEYPFLHDQS